MGLRQDAEREHQKIHIIYLEKKTRAERNCTVDCGMASKTDQESGAVIDWADRICLLEKKSLVREQTGVSNIPMLGYEEVAKRDAWGKEQPCGPAHNSMVFLTVGQFWSYQIVKLTSE